LGFIVVLRDGLDPTAESARLASTCGFAVKMVSSAGHSFTAVLDIVQLGCVRCDPAVTFVEADAVLYPLLKP
jgi:hypothetical protein